MSTSNDINVVGLNMNNKIISMNDKYISLEDLKAYLKKEKQEFMEYLIPIHSKYDLSKISRKYINQKVVNDLYSKSKEFEQKFFQKIQKYEMSLTEKEGKLNPLELDKKKAGYIRVTKNNFLKRFYNIYSDKPNSFYKLEYEFDDLISLDKKLEKLGKEVSKVLFTGQTLEYIVTDDNITECAFFEDPPNTRYWAFRFHLFHNLRTYLKSGEPSNTTNQFFFNQEERANIINDIIKKNANKKSYDEVHYGIENHEQSKENFEDGDDEIADASYYTDNNVEFQEGSSGFKREEPFQGSNNENFETFESEENLDKYVEEQKKIEIEEDGDYNGSDDAILSRNELDLMKNLYKHKNNNIIKNAILNDFKPIYLTNELWFSVTPEDISMLMADYCYKKMSNNGAIKLKGIAMDITGGSGLDSISLSKYWPKVIAVDINMENLYSAFKNAQNYNVQDKISFIHNDFNDPVFFNLFKKIYKGKIDLIYSSPPWSGPSYGELKLYDVDEHLGMDGLTSLIRKTLQITNNCCFFLPKNSSVNQIMTIARFHYQKTNPPVKIIYVSLRGKTKGALVLFGKQLTTED